MDYMARAISLAVRAKRICKPNPAVGAIVALDDEVLGEGFTQPAGQAHAEIKALEQAGERAHGASLYVTLEPCSHHGRTAPCADAIIAAGLREVHAAMIDPSPWVNGRGLQRLKDAGIRTTLGDSCHEARELNADYFTWVERGRPMVTAICEGSIRQARKLSSLHELRVVVHESIEALACEADRLVVDREVDADILAWSRAFESLAAESVQHVILDASFPTLECLVRQGLIDRIAVLPSIDSEERIGLGRPEERLEALTLNGLVACSPVS